MTCQDKKPAGTDGFKNFMPFILRCFQRRWRTQLFAPITTLTDVRRIACERLQSFLNFLEISQNGRKDTVSPLLLRLNPTPSSNKNTRLARAFGEGNSILNSNPPGGVLFNLLLARNSKISYSSRQGYSVKQAYANSEE
jgi:hypothetical protein